MWDFPDIAGELATLREGLSLGIIGSEEFCRSAAQCYERACQPARAAALRGRSFDTKYLPRRSCSLTMIVKNETLNIAAVLDSCDLLFDEIIVCDTGSSDNTVSIARRYGVQIVIHPWRNDFSAARNASLAAATGDMIFWLDADDRLPALSHPPIRALIAEPLDRAYYLRINNERSGGIEHTLSAMQIRMFPRRDSLRFSQRIHEQIRPALAAAGIPLENRPDIAITHTGYADPAISSAKAERNIRLINEELLVAGDDPLLTMSLADSLMVLGRFDEAEDLYARIADTMQYSPEELDIHTQALVKCGAIAFRKNDEALAKLRYEQAIAADPSRIEAQYQLGVIARRNEQDQEAFVYFHKAAVSVVAERITVSDTLRIRIEALYQLVDLLLDHGNLPEALRIADASIADFPQVVEFRTMAGEAAFRLDDHATAADHFAAAIAMDPLFADQARAGLLACRKFLNDGPPVTFIR